MRVLVIKTSSLGDVLHTLPALTDAAHALPGVRFDWLIEEAFAEVPAWHPAVDTVIPVALRRWRKDLYAALRSGEWMRFYQALRARRYDAVIDAQGLIKSALLTRLARGPRHGLDAASAREPWSARAYQHLYTIPRTQHAITRVRQLFAAALGYAPPSTPPDYGIGIKNFSAPAPAGDYIVFLHGTAWSSKQWPEDYWVQLARRAYNETMRVRLPWGSALELARARRIAAAVPNAEVLPNMNLTELARVLTGARAAVGVDSGLAHLAAALAVPAVTIYGATRPSLTGTWGTAQSHLCAEFSCAPCLRRVCTYSGASAQQPACYERITPDEVWQALRALLH